MSELCRRAFDAIVVDIDADVRVEQKQIDAIELDAIDFRFGGEVEHGIEVDARFRAGAAFADEAGPHGIVEFGKITVSMLRAHKSLGIYFK